MAVIRPGSWELPLFIHVAGAMLLVGSVVVVLGLSAATLRGGAGTAALTRLAFRILLYATIPAFIVMRVGAEWIASKEDVSDPSWVGVGYSVSDPGLVLIIIAVVCAWRTTKRRDGGPGGLDRAIVALSGLLLLAFTIAIWAMTTKPG